MVEPTKLLSNALSFTVPQNAVESLERIRDSYKGLSERETITWVDQAVLAAAEMTLKHLAKASWCSRSDPFVLRATSAYPRNCRPAPGPGTGSDRAFHPLTYVAAKAPR
jgi:hypothetical protein